MSEFGIDPETIVEIERVAFGIPNKEIVGFDATGPRRVFDIIRTNQQDPYARLEPEIEDAPAERPVSDVFTGHHRKVAKIKIVEGDPDEYADLGSLLKSLEKDEVMQNHEPPLTRAEDCDRVEEEERNVRVHAFLWAASRQKDNDYHVILGRTGRKPTRFMNVEISGLPPRRTKDTERLRAVRETFESAVRGTRLGLPNVGKYDFYRPPFPVIVEGSLFYDISHDGVGPPDASADTMWEIHPISELEFIDDGQVHESFHPREDVDRFTILDIAEFPNSSRKLLRTTQTDPEEADS